VDQIDFEKLVATYYENLFRFAMSLSRSENRALDLTQQTFYLWAAKGHQLRDNTKVKSWLFTTLYREFLGSRRRETRFPHHNMEDVGSELPHIASQIVNDLDGQSVVDSLAEVDELYRAPLVLFYLEELSYAEIAITLDVPIGTVMSRLSRGKAQLRKLLSVVSLKEQKKKVVEIPRDEFRRSRHG
jgi:RNA polymerase sigma-70 factor (ECF subfamily)